MSDYQSKLDAINKTHAESLKALERETGILKLFNDAGLPVPDYVGGLLFGAVGVRYRNDIYKPRGLNEAVELFARFPEVTLCTIMRNGCTTVRPEKLMPQKEIDKGYKRDPYASDYAISLKVSHIQDSHTSASLEFFAMVGGVAFEVNIEFGTGYIGKCPQLAPEVKTDRDGRGRVVSRNFTPQSKITAHSDNWLSFASGDIGPIKTSSNNVFLFVADYADENAPAIQNTHAIECLKTIANATGA